MTPAAVSVANLLWHDSATSRRLDEADVRHPPQRVTKSSVRWAQAGWAKCIARAIRDSSATSRSKSCRAPALKDESARARLVREARLAASLNHPSICVVHDVGETDGLVYVAMELVDGRPLTEVIPNEGLPPDAVSRLGVQIAGALAHAHERGIVHRDLKAANVVATPEGRVKVLDLDWRRDTSRRWTRPRVRPRASIHRVWSPARCPTWRQRRCEGRRPIRNPTSVVGVLLYELASGRRPFQGTTGVDLSSAIVRDSPPPLPSHVSPSLKAIVSRCLQKEPAARYADAGQVHAALAAAEVSVATRRGWTPRLPRLIAALGVVALIVAAIVVVPQWRPAPAREDASGTINPWPCSRSKTSPVKRPRNIWPTGSPTS